MHTGELITQALDRAGLGELPASAKEWAAARLARYGYSHDAQNIGALSCTLPHDHADGHCVPVVSTRQETAVRRIARCGSWDQAAQLFVGVARRAGAVPHDPVEDLPNVGFRSTHPADDEVGDFRDDVQSASSLLLGPLTTRAVFGPSAEAEGAFRGLLADWESFERAGVPGKFPELKDTHDNWTPFRDAWLAGRADVTALNAQVADANRVRLTLAERTKDPQWQGPPRHGVDIEDATPALQAGKEVLKAADTYLPKPLANPGKWWSELPMTWKLAAGGGLVVIGGAALAYVAAPVLLTLSGLGLGGRGAQVVVVQPPASRAVRGGAK